MSPDPYGQFSSPYLGMGNRPNMMVDPDGGMTDCPKCPDYGLSSDNPIELDGLVSQGYKADTNWIADAWNTVNDKAFAFGTGLTNAYLSDVTLNLASTISSGRNTIFARQEGNWDHKDIDAFIVGQTTGDVISFAQGVYETGQGLLLTFGGGAAEILSGGTATPIAIPVSGVGVLETLHGAGTSYTALKGIWKNAQLFAAHRQGGGSNLPPGNWKKIKEGKRANEYARKKGYKEAHDLKESNGGIPPKEWDIYVDNKTGEAILVKQSDKSIWLPVY